MRSDSVLGEFTLSDRDRTLQRVATINVSESALASIFRDDLIPIFLDFATDRGVSSEQSANFSKRGVATFFEAGLTELEILTSPNSR